MQFLNPCPKPLAMRVYFEPQIKVQKTGRKKNKETHIYFLPLAFFFVLGGEAGVFEEVSASTRTASSSLPWTEVPAVEVVGGASTDLVVVLVVLAPSVEAAEPSFNSFINPSWILVFFLLHHWRSSSNFFC